VRGLISGIVVSSSLAPHDVAHAATRRTRARARPMSRKRPPHTTVTRPSARPVGASPRTSAAPHHHHRAGGA